MNSKFNNLLLAATGSFKQLWRWSPVFLVLFIAGCNSTPQPAGSSVNAAAPPAAIKELRIGYQKYGTLNIIKARGQLDKALKDQGTRIKWIEFPGGPQLLEALNAGSLDFGHTGESPPIFAQAANTPLVYIAHESPNPTGEAILVPKNSPIKTVADLKGKIVALNKGSNVHFLLVQALEEAKVDYKDVNVKYLTPADGRAAFESGNVDAWVIWDPFQAAAQTQLGAKVLKDATGLAPNHEFYLSSKDLAAQHPAIIKEILKAVAEADDWTNKNIKAAAELLSPQLGIDVPTLELAGKRRPYGVNPITPDVVEYQQKIADTFHQLGLLPDAIKVQENVYQGSEDLLPAS